MIQRRQKIVQLIEKEGQINFSALKAQFPEVSEMTLRTDLKSLDESGQIIRIHGGARSIETVSGTYGAISQRNVRNVEQKKEIAAKAAGMIHSHSSVFIDSGSTAVELCRNVPDEPCVIYTSGVNCATELSSLTRPRTYLPGGQLNRYSLSITGGQAANDLRSCHFDICFIGVTSFSPEYGFCCENKDDALLKSAAIARSDVTAVLMDSSKFGMANAHCFAEIGDVDIVITDGAMTAEQRSFFTEHGITVL